MSYNSIDILVMLKEYVKDVEGMRYKYPIMMSWLESFCK